MYGSDFDMGPLVTLFFADNYKILEYIVSSTNNRPLHILECLHVQQHCITKFFRHRADNLYKITIFNQINYYL